MTPNCHRSPPLAPQVKWSAHAAALVLAISFAAPVAAQTCPQLIESIDSAKTGRTDHQAERNALQERINTIEQGAVLFRQRLESGDCRPATADAGARDDPRPTCESLLRIVLEAQKGRVSAESAIAELDRRAVESADSEKKLVQQAAAEGCPPYGKPAPKAATAARKPAPTRRRTTVQRRQPAPPPPALGGFSIILGPGRGIGIGF